MIAVRPRLAEVKLHVSRGVDVMADEGTDIRRHVGPSPGVRLELASGRGDPRIADVITVGDAASATLGMLARTIYQDYAQEKGLLLALDPAGIVVGYSLFDLTVRQLSLVHLCVAPGYRKRGVAHQMVDWISRQHRERPGILAWCRRDYNLGPVWSALGFVRLAERPGRGRQPKGWSLGGAIMATLL